MGITVDARGDDGVACEEDDGAEDDDAAEEEDDLYDDDVESSGSNGRPTGTESPFWPTFPMWANGKRGP